MISRWSKMIVLSLVVLPSASRSVACPVELYHVQPGASGLELTAPQKQAYLDLINDDKSRLLQRSETNSTESIQNSSLGKDEFLKEINFRDFFSFEDKKLYDGEWESFPVDLMTNLPLVARNVKSPIQNPAEILHMQKAFKELFAHLELRKAMNGWRDQNGWSNSTMQDLRDLGSTVKSLGSYDASSIRYAIEFVIGLPGRLNALTLSLKDARSLRLRQLAWFAQELNVESIRSAAPRLAALLKQSTDSELPAVQQVAAFNEASKLADESVLSRHYFKNLFYLQDQYNYFSALADFTAEKNWKFPLVVPPPADGPYLKIVNGHSPVLLADSNAPTSVGNSLEMGYGNGQHQPNVLIITGPNAEGKSTFLRMVAQNLLLAHLGLPVPADQMIFTPTSLYFHVNPSDAPSQNMSLFVNQSHQLRKKVFERVGERQYGRQSGSPHHVIFLDEILPGTIPALRTAAEKVFLRELAPRNSLVFVATHNWGTTSLEAEDPTRFRNFHVARYSVQPGAQIDYEAMIQGGAAALRTAGWPEREVAMFIVEARIEAEKEKLLAELLLREKERGK